MDQGGLGASRQVPRLQPLLIANTEPGVIYRCYTARRAEFVRKETHEALVNDL